MIFLLKSVTFFMAFGSSGYRETTGCSNKLGPTQIFPWRFTVGLWNFASSSLQKLPVVMAVLLLDRSNGVKLISNWYKLNTDRSSLGNPGKTRRGGIIRDYHGHWVGDFARAIESASCVVTELRALRDGLTLCHQLHIQSPIVELDASVIVNLLINDSIFLGHYPHWIRQFPITRFNTTSGRPIVLSI